MDTLFEPVTDGIGLIVREWEERLLGLSAETITLPRNRQNRNIKQIVGHLTDSASNNHQRMVRLQYNNPLTFPDYRQDNDRWIALQNYQSEDWQALVGLWKFYNLHIIHIIKEVDTSKLDNSWQDFEGNTVTLRDMITGYLDHLQLHISEIEELLK